jgi:hypothetical protein
MDNQETSATLGTRHRTVEKIKQDTITIIPRKLAEIMTQLISVTRIFMTAYFPVLVQILQ